MANWVLNSQAQGATKKRLWLKMLISKNMPADIQRTPYGWQSIKQSL